MFALFALFVAANAAEYVSITYGTGSIEISEFGKCYCFADDGCYKYVKDATDNTKVNEYQYDLITQSNCISTEGEPEPAVFTLNQKAEKDITASHISQALQFRIDEQE